jgi:hypothetical protein
MQILEYTTGEVAGQKIETYAVSTTAIVAYVDNAAHGGNRDGGFVVREKADRELRQGSSAQIFGLQKAPELNGLQVTCQQWLADQQRWQVRLGNGDAKNVKLENLRAVDGFRVTIPASFGTDVKVTMQSDGGLSWHRQSFEAEFDGSSIVAKSGPREGQVWRKAGYWRLDFLTKVLLTMAVVGVEAMFTAAVLPPGVISEDSARMPLKAVFLIDGSGSITPPQWQAAMQANKAFISDFSDVYGSDPGQLNFGLVQFSTDAHVELPITDDLSKVTAVLDNMVHREGSTNFDRALAQCQKLLADYTDAGQKTFDVCVLITDGEDTSESPINYLKSLTVNDTAVFGIFVGSSHLTPGFSSNMGSHELHDLTGCGKAEGLSKQGCDFFASATDFEGLSEKTHEIAEDVTNGADLALCAGRSALMETPFLIGLILPSVLWYLSCCTVTIAERKLQAHRKASYDLLGLQDQA